MKKIESIQELERLANRLRIDILNMLHKAGSGHTGGSLSAIDIMASLYFGHMRHSPDASFTGTRDRFILSKGHGAPALYACLGNAGYFDKKLFSELRRIHGKLSGHPYAATTPGVDVCTGSLGQGLSMGNGMALAAKLDKLDSRIYVMLGDGEIQEGQIWEAAMTAAHYKLDNVIAILDNNGLQIDGPNAEIMGIEPIGEKWKAFGWHVIEINGHDFAQIRDALNKADANLGTGKPTIIWAHTVKGKGVPFMEGKVQYHGVSPTDDELKKALEILEPLAK